MKIKLFASVMAFALCQFMLATDMIVKQKNGEIKRFNVEDVEEVIFNENAMIPNDSIVVDASETPLKFSIKSDSTVEVTGVNSNSETIKIPSKVKIDDKVYTVNSIGSRAFSWNRSLKTLEIPSSITNIAESPVFDGNSNLKSINVTSDNPNYSSVDGVLYNKDKTKIVCVPGGIRGDFTIPSSVNCIGFSAFADDSLTSVKIPSSVTTIDYNAFNGCKMLTSIDIPASVTDIKGSAFANCFKLTNINVATDNAKYISVDGILYNKDKTEIVTFPAGIIKDTFSIPSTVTSIEGCAFMGCNIERIEVPSSVTNIGDGAFWNCNFIIIDNIMKNITIGEYAFTNCTHVIFSKETLVIVGDPDLSVVMDTADIKKLTFVTLSDSTAKVLYGTADIDSLYIPARIKIDEKIYTVTSIEDHAFDFIEGNLIGVKIPSTITRIGKNAFPGSYMDEIEIPSSVTEIGKEAFADCRLLKKVVIDNSKDNVEVGENAFGGCKSVTWLKE